MNAPYHPETQTKYGGLSDHDLCRLLRTHDDPLVLLLIERLDVGVWVDDVFDDHNLDLDDVDELLTDLRESKRLLEEEYIHPQSHEEAIKELERTIAELEHEIKDLKTQTSKGNNEMSLEAQMEALTTAVVQLADRMDTLNANVTDAAGKTKPAPVKQEKPKAAPAKKAKPEPKPEPEEAPADNDNESADLKADALAALTKVAEQIDRAASLKIMLQYSNGEKQFSKVDPDFYGNIIEDCEAKIEEAA